MPNEYYLSPRQIRIVRGAARLFLLASIFVLVGGAIAVAKPGFGWHCDATGCVDRTDLLRIAPEAARNSLAATPDALQRFAAYVARPQMRIGLGIAAFTAVLPFAVLLACVAKGLGQLARRERRDLARALPWFRRATYAALAMALLGPIAESAVPMLLYPGTPLGPRWEIAIDVIPFALNLLLALAALSAVWALDAGSRTERELEGFV